MVVAELPDHVQRKISVQIITADGTSAAALVDLSLSGMLVAVVNLRVDIGDSVTTTIEYDGLVSTLKGAIVRSADDHTVGIHFPGSIQEGEFDPPVRLARIHRLLEQAWLKARKEATPSPIPRRVSRLF